METSMSLELRSKEVKETGKKRGLVTWLAYAAGVLLAGFVVFSIVTTNMRINEYQAQYETLSDAVSAMNDSNEEIQRYLDEEANLDEYIEKIARDKLDYANPDERVYYVVPAA